METFLSQQKVELNDPDNPPVQVIKGNLKQLPQTVIHFIFKYIEIFEPKALYICDGSDEESKDMLDKLVDQGQLEKLTKLNNCYLCRTDPADVARVESKTFIVTRDKFQTVPHVAAGAKGILGQWMSPDMMEKELDSRLPGCMKGRVMYVLPFSMGPIGGPLSKIGVQITDSSYVVLSMKIMTRMTSTIWNEIEKSGEYVECVHSIGAPYPIKRRVINHWPCDPDRIIISHFPDERKIVSYGSGYGGNSLLGKKCLALRIASCIAKDEGWLAEHMLILGVTNPAGEEKFIAAAFPSACGKTNMAMLTPSLPGWKVNCVGDDIAWMKFGDDGRLYAINPEAGFFGVAPGTNNRTNPAAMATCQSNTIFTNVAMTEDGGVFWEGLEKEVDKDIKIKTWLGEDFKIGDPGKAAHPNSRFCTPATQCPVIHPRWEDKEGVPIDAIVFGGRRPVGVPLIYETFGWEHGVLVGAALKSEATAAAEFKGREIMHDPMAMRPFMGYNFGDYLRHWLSLNRPDRKMPKIFHVNWFRLGDKGQFLWPGFGENIRVIDWMCQRLNGADIIEPSPIGFLPKKGSINIEGLKDIDWESLFSLPADYWKEDAAETRHFLEEQVGIDLPSAIIREMQMQEQRIAEM